MTANQESFVKKALQALTELWTNLGAVAWVILGVLLVTGILASVMVWRWIFRGGLSRRSVLGFSATWPWRTRRHRRLP